MKRLIFTIALCVLFTASFVLADWDPDDSYKMHYPQLPDPEGRNVYATAPRVLADDWECTSTCLVSDIHLWGSWQGDKEGIIDAIYVSIHKDVPAGVDNPWSHPGTAVWERDFISGQFTVRDYGTGNQGWYDPYTGEYIMPDHKKVHQINIVRIDDQFTQEEGNIYWLDISVRAAAPDGTEPFWGWKTSLDHFNDAAVFSDLGILDEWQPLYDPTGQNLDLAFVMSQQRFVCSASEL